MQWRYVIGMMICAGCMINYVVRGIMSIVILAMTQSQHNGTETLPDYGPRYAWSAYEQSLVIGSYFWGTFVTTFIAGVFAERYGARNVVGFGVISAAILSVVVPVAATYLWISTVVRFFTGMAMATVTPSMQSLVANWVPTEEKGKFLAAFSANGIGNVIDWSMSGFIIKYYGWHYVFYVIVLILGIFVVAWFTIIYNSPRDHPRITTKEKEFIFKSLGTSDLAKKPWPPIKAMLLSIPFWALVIFHFGVQFAQYIFLTATPKYLSEVHHFDIATTGVLSSIPYFVRVFFSIGFGFVGDFLFQTKKLSPDAIRKGFSIFSHILPACFLIGLSFTGSRPYTCVALMSIALGSCGSTAITSLQNPHDLSPNFATTIFGFIHTVGSIPGFIAPLIVAHYTKEKSTEEEWRSVFLIGAALLIGSAVIFIIFGSAKVQKWNHIPDDDSVEGRVTAELSKLSTK